ncbi:MAG: winged helix-turn-helix transcriptional regulator [Nitrospiraceae bacterium]|nr:MAG: winged helix-turn-helix transcriptional regulator [Nitrospiraceae bacterium]
MRELLGIFKLVSDELRVRILLLLSRKELSVCQLMGITWASQPLVSRNLSLLSRGGFLDERREGKLRFYSIRKGLAPDRTAVLGLLRSLLKTDARYKDDRATLRECSRFQKNAGKCDMKTLQEFMAWKKRKEGGR